MSPTDKPENESRTFSFLHSGKRTLVYEKRFALWIVVWGFVIWGCKYLIRNELVVAPFSWGVAFFPVLFALIPLRAYYQFFTKADELIRKMQVESICISFVAGLFYTIANLMLVDVGWETADARDVLNIMMWTFGLSSIYTAWKYR